MKAEETEIVRGNDGKREGSEREGQGEGGRER